MLLGDEQELLPHGGQGRVGRQAQPVEAGVRRRKVVDGVWASVYVQLGGQATEAIQGQELDRGPEEEDRPLLLRGHAPHNLTRAQEINRSPGKSAFYLCLILIN